MTTNFDPYSPVYQRVIDGVIAALAFWLAYQAFFSAAVPALPDVQLWELIFVIAAGRIAANQLLGCYRTVWRYFGLRDLIVLNCSCGLLSALLFLTRFIAATPLLKIPAGIVLLELLLSSSGMSAARAARRLLYERSVVRQGIPNGHDRVLLIGAGRAGVSVANNSTPAAACGQSDFSTTIPRKSACWWQASKSMARSRCSTPLLAGTAHAR